MLTIFPNGRHRPTPTRRAPPCIHHASRAGGTSKPTEIYAERRCRAPYLYRLPVLNPIQFAGMIILEGQPSIVTQFLLFFLSCSATCSAPSTSVVEEFSTRSFANQAAACTPDLTWWTCTCFAAYPATSLMPSCTVTPTISILFLVSPASSRAPTLALTRSSGHLLVKRSRR